MKPLLTLTEHRTMHGQVVDAVGLAIMGHDFAEGSSLPNEDTLAAELAVSRSVVREAMKALAAKGMVELRPRTGTRVLAQVNWNFLDPDVLRWHALTDQRSLIDNTVELRAIVEPAAAALAAARATEQEVASLRLDLEGMQLAHKNGNTEAFNEVDASFHVRVIQMSHNPMIAATAVPLRLGLNACFEFSSAPAGALLDAIPLHFRLVESIANREPQAAHNVLEQMLATSRNNISKIAAEGTAPGRLSNNASRLPRTEKAVHPLRRFNKPSPVSKEKP